MVFDMIISAFSSRFIFLKIIVSFFLSKVRVQFFFQRFMHLDTNQHEFQTIPTWRSCQLADFLAFAFGVV